MNMLRVMMTPFGLKELQKLDRVESKSLVGCQFKYVTAGKQQKFFLNNLPIWQTPVCNG